MFFIEGDIFFSSLFVVMGLMPVAELVTLGIVGYLVEISQK
jgi:hypothetical protein